jgi:RNA polymerase sigma-70 factor, ECF subfamily
MVLAEAGPRAGAPDLTISWRAKSDSDESGDGMGAAEQRVDVPLEHLEDRGIIERVLEGDREAYGVLVQRYQSKLFAVAFGVLRHREDAREVAQEAFIKAYRNLPGFRRDSSFYTWIYRITLNLAIDFQRKAWRKRETTFEDVRLGPDEINATGPRPMGNPSEKLESKRLAETIHSAIDQLPADQRTAIILREIQGLSYKEIAETMGCAEGTVMSRLYYARKKLQEMLKDVR